MADITLNNTFIVFMRLCGICENDESLRRTLFLQDLGITLEKYEKIHDKLRYY